MHDNPRTNTSASKSVVAPNGRSFHFRPVGNSPDTSQWLDIEDRYVAEWFESQPGDTFEVEWV